MRNLVSIIAALVLGLSSTLSPPDAHASQAGAPPITKDHIMGTWEGFNGDELRVFLVIVAKQSTTAAIGFGFGDGRSDFMTFSISKTTFDKGKVHWEGVSLDSDKRYRVDIRGRGTVRVIATEWRLFGPKGEDINVSWPVKLVGPDGVHMERIVDLSIATRQRLAATPPSK